MSEIVVLVGILVFFAGLHVLWQARGDILYWVEQYLRIMRASLRVVMDPEHPPLLLKKEELANRQTLRLVGGVGLVFLGQILVIAALVSRW